MLRFGDASFLVQAGVKSIFTAVVNNTPDYEHDLLFTTCICMAVPGSLLPIQPSGNRV